jgi:hypothetical protein
MQAGTAAPRRTWPNSSPPKPVGPRPACLDTHGGNGFVDDYDVKRKFRETRMDKVAPVNNNLGTNFVATKLLGLPRSY